MAKFKIGDKVRCVEATYYVQLGAEGVVTRINDKGNLWYVNWSTLDKILKLGDSSWWINTDQIELIEPAEPLALIAPDTAKLARIERWAGLAMQGMLADVTTSVDYELMARWSFDYADAMEAEFQRRYNNNNKTD